MKTLYDSPGIDLNSPSPDTESAGKASSVKIGRPDELEALAHPSWEPPGPSQASPALPQPPSPLGDRKSGPAVITILPDETSPFPFSCSPGAHAFTYSSKTGPVHSPAKGQMRVAAYCRVSTDLDAQKSSFENQRKYYIDQIRSNPHWVLAGLYCEQGVSATGKERQPELERLLADCRAGMIDMVLCKSISRLARNVEGCLTIIRELVSLGIAFRIEKEHLCSDTMDSELLLTILAAFAEAESKSISGNVRWGIQKQFRDGTYKISRPPYGYRIENGNYVLVEEEAAIVSRIYMEMLNGSGTGTIAAALNKEGIPSPRSGYWRKGAVLSTLRNPFYCGDALFQKTYIDEHFRQKKNKGEKDQFLVRDHHTPLIPREIFLLANGMISQHGKDLHNTGQNRKRYPLSGKLVCARCGSKLGRVDRGKYRCAKRSDHLCRLPDIYEEDVHNHFTTALNKLFYLEKELSLLARVPSAGRNFENLKSFLAGRGIRSSFLEDDAGALEMYIRSILVFSRERIKICFRFGLVLDEQAETGK